MPRKRKSPNLELDFTGGSARSWPDLALDWPAADRFPLNLHGKAVSDQVLSDLRESSNPLLIAGYASLSQLIDFVVDCEGCEHVRVLLGNEPFPSLRKDFSSARISFDQEVVDYWASRGISLRLSAKIVRVITLIQSGKLAVRKASESRQLHAKVYCGDQAVTIGSSNFTRYGLTSQLEANVRFTAPRDRRRFAEAKSIAENYWSLGDSFNEELIGLLGQLLKVVQWQEGLARACTELLEGEWARSLFESDYLVGENLWPSQKQGIAQALYILATQGSVLIADATGSGKTKMGVHLVAAIQNEIQRSNRIRKGKPLLVCPPLVEDQWKEELAKSSISMDVTSQGRLSRLDENNWVVTSLRTAQILCVDEGHNFLNPTSNRTQQLLRNIADHVVLFTATPINRGVRDLLNIADLLGADNLRESTLEAFRGILGFRAGDTALTEENLAAIRSEVQRFTVRRTKKDLNQLIAQEPMAYRSRYDQPCRFPRHVPKFYTLNEHERDCELAEQIAQLASQLKAVGHFKKGLRLTPKMRRLGWSEEMYLHRRLASAKQLAGYAVMATLRSSTAALVEHIVGTAQAKLKFDFEEFQKPASGAMLKRLYGLRGSLPKSHLSEGVDLPDWLRDQIEHERACTDDLRIYQQIRDLADEMSSRRETSKAQRIYDLYCSRGLLLAFDSRPITLAYLRKLLLDLDPNLPIVIATGDAASDRRELLRAFQPGSKTESMIGLCSDSLSEGVNLQQTSTIVHLDMPSVVRIAEQRAGRVDRLDSPHDQIEAWWPDDKPAFRLSSDERFLERHETVDALIGSNMPLPEGLKGTSRRLDTREIVREYETTTDPWDEIHDAFHSVRSLIHGDSALILPKLYRASIGVTHRVLCRVSLVAADSPWAFMCLSGGEYEAPRWILFATVDSPPVTDLDVIVQLLRERLGSDTESLDLDERATQLIDRFIVMLTECERGFLPRKKQRALEELEQVLTEFVHASSEERQQSELEVLHRLLRVFQVQVGGMVPQWDEIASRWLDIIRPTWFQKLDQPRSRPLLLKDIRKDLLGSRELIVPQLVEQFTEIPLARPPEERIQACIIGVS
jgi:hypothetical protein|tara:strand:+ start:1421 stop:4660 length:3240 start_codon:yes stop_codon:yes gene_type:complete